MNTATPPPRILVIDDTRAIHDDFRKILMGRSQPSLELDALDLEMFGEVAQPRPRGDFEMHSAYQGQEGLAMLTLALDQQRPYAMAFVDIRMPPGWDGIETIARMWQVDPGLQVVVCTAYSDYSWDQMIERFGHSDRLLILKKPFDTVEVLQLATALTEKWRLQQKSQAEADQLIKQRTAELESAVEHLKAELERRGGMQATAQAHPTEGAASPAAP